MTWKQLDSDTVAADEPMDAFVLRGMEGNLQSAYTERTRRWGTTWSAAERPILGCHVDLGWMIGIHPLNVGVTELTVTVQLAVAEADVNLKIGVRSSLGWTEGDEVVVGTGAVGFEAITVDVSAHRGVCALFLIVRSEIGALMGTTGTTTGDKFGFIAVDLTGLMGGLTFVDDERYMMLTTDPSASTMDLREDPRPGPRTVMHNPIGAGFYPDMVWAWPAVQDARPFTLLGSYQIEFYQLGAATLYGYDVVETEVTPLVDLTESITAGNKPAFDAFGALYRNGYEIARNRTRVYAGGPTPKTSDLVEDRLGDSYGHWGPWLRGHNFYSSAVPSVPERYLASCMIGNVDDDTISTVALSNAPRTNYRVLFAVVCPFNSVPSEFVLDARVTISSFAAGAWTASQVTADLVTNNQPNVVTVPNGVTDDPDKQQAVLLDFGLDEMVTFHTLRGAWIPARLRESSFAGIQIIEIAVDDTFAGLNDKRLLTLQLQCAARALNGNTLVYAVDPEWDRNVQFWVPAMCVYTEEGFT